MFTNEQKKQFSLILEELGKVLDIPESKYNQVVKSYEAVGNYLARENSALAPYKPTIHPQGSFMLGIMIKPIHENDDLDIDLVCKLTGKNPIWTQKDLKTIVGDELKANDTYKNMLDKEGRRCWTLIYSETANYHMDILPSIVSENYNTILEKAFSDNNYTDFDKISIRITDREKENYFTSTNLEDWLKSNPFGYKIWFFSQAIKGANKTLSFKNYVEPIHPYEVVKLPLQRVIQILKRHRDMMFNGNKDKPISIIITTLASKAYNGEQDILEALVNIIDKMPNLIETKSDNTKWVQNPVNNEENFADKWKDYPNKETNFYAWMKQVKADILEVTQKKGLPEIKLSLEKAFGKEIIQKIFTNYGEALKTERENGNLRMAEKTGIIGTSGILIPKHTFYGKEE